MANQWQDDLFWSQPSFALDNGDFTYVQRLDPAFFANEIPLLEFTSTRATKGALPRKPTQPISRTWTDPETPMRYNYIYNPSKDQPLSDLAGERLTAPITEPVEIFFDHEYETPDMVARRLAQPRPSEPSHYKVRYHALLTHYKNKTRTVGLRFTKVSGNMDPGRKAALIGRGQMFVSLARALMIAANYPGSAFTIDSHKANAYVTWKRELCPETVQRFKHFKDLLCLPPVPLAEAHEHRQKRKALEAQKEVDDEPSASLKLSPKRVKIENFAQFSEQSETSQTVFENSNKDDSTDNLLCRFSGVQRLGPADPDSGLTDRGPGAPGPPADPHACHQPLFRESIH